MYSIATLKNQIINMPYRISNNDIDQFGHVNHAKSIVILEKARKFWAEQTKMTFANTLVPVVTQISVQYCKEIIGGEVVVATQLTKIGFYEILFEQKIKKINSLQDTCLVSASITICLIDRENSIPQKTNQYFA